MRALRRREGGASGGRHESREFWRQFLLEGRIGCVGCGSRRGAELEMASTAARRLAWVSIRPGALWSGPRGRRGTDVYTVPGSSGLSQVPSRSVIVTRSGAILPKPVKMSFGLLRVFSIVVPFLYVGTLISKNFAALLEEHDIFVPEDDDDDD